MEAAAALSAVMMAGPGKMCAFVMLAQRAMRRGPAVYCFWTVSGTVVSLCYTLPVARWLGLGRERTSNITELAVFEDDEGLLARDLHKTLRSTIGPV